MTVKPLIGVTSYHRNEEDRFTLPANYLEVIERAGGLPVVICPTMDDPGALIDKLDGVMLTGGADIHPDEYSGEYKEAVYGVNRERDRYELKLTQLVLQRGLPAIAICRGLQVLNVALGGTLVEHIPDEYGESVIHRGADLNKVEHPVSIEPQSNLAAILGTAEFNCPSYHHQSVRDPAPGFRVVAQSADGVIEAIESVEHPQVIAVQWHPEYTAQTDESQQRLFDALVQWSGEYLPERDQPATAMPSVIEAGA